MDQPRDRFSLALERVLSRFEGTVRGVGIRYGLDTAEFSELFQDVRIRLWRAFESRDGMDHLPASYVYRTATSAAVDLIRRERREGRNVRLDPDIPDPNPSNPERAVTEAEIGARIDGALESLSDRRRPVVRMYLAGYGHKEIATLLGWSDGTTRNLLYRGLADLRGRLADEQSVRG